MKSECAFNFLLCTGTLHMLRAVLPCLLGDLYVFWDWHRSADLHTQRDARDESPKKKRIMSATVWCLGGTCLVDTSANQKKKHTYIHMTKGKPQQDKSRRRQLNPAFAKSHGLVGKSSGRSNQEAFHQAIIHARNTGKLHISNLALRSPLPKECFDLQNDVVVDISLDNSNDKKSWEWYTAASLTSVDLSDNDLGSSNALEGHHNNDKILIGRLDERIDCYKSLKVFRAKRCRISMLPLHSIYSLQSLSVLDLSGNLIAHAVPIEYFPPTLTEINLSCNLIPQLYDTDNENTMDKNITVLPSCKTLNVSNNLLTTIFPTVWKVEGLSNLQTLNCEGNKIHGPLLPQETIMNLRSLHTLDASKNMISDAPDLSRLSKLKAAYLSENHLKDAPTINLALSRLALSNNQISSIENLFGISNGETLTGSLSSELVELSLHGNKLNALDQRIMTKCTKLVLLDVADNDLTDLPYILGYLPDLRKVILDGNPLRSIRSALVEDTEKLKKSLRCKGELPEGEEYSSSFTDIGRIEQISRTSVSTAFTNLHTLDLSNQNIDSIPQNIRLELQVLLSSLDCDSSKSKTVGSLLTTLKLRGNRLRHFDPHMFDEMGNLRNLDVANNKLECLSQCFHHVPLNSLYLEKNLLTTDAIRESSLCHGLSTPLIKNLVHLNLSSNLLISVPVGLFNLSRLSTLILSHNRISELDEWRPGLESLEHLDLSNNSITNLTELPPILSSSSPILKTLLVNNNNICVIPPELGLLSTLQSIDLKGNPQKSIRSAVLDGSCSSILNYLSCRLTEEDIRHFHHKTHSLKLTQAKMPLKEDLPCKVKVPVSSIAPTVEHKRVEDCSSSAATSNEEQRQGENVVALLEEIDALTIELRNVYSSEAKKYALKKSLALKKAHLSQIRRRLATNVEAKLS
jgi:Leucine-rich repeat (LRR) protein